MRSLSLSLPVRLYPKNRGRRKGKRNDRVVGQLFSGDSSLFSPINLLPRIVFHLVVLPEKPELSETSKIPSAVDFEVNDRSKGTSFPARISRNLRYCSVSTGGIGTGTKFGVQVTGYSQKRYIPAGTERYQQPWF